MLSSLKRLLNRNAWESAPLNIDPKRLRPVRQSEFAIARADDSRNVLSTENVWTCSAFVGIDATNKIAFLCHLDWPPNRASVQQLTDRLTQEVGGTKNFKVYLVTGIWRGWTWIFPALIIGSCLIWDPKDWRWFLGAAAFTMCFLSFARVGLWVHLWCTKAFGQLPKIVGCSHNTIGLRLSGVSVDAADGAILPVRSYWSNREYDRYKWLDDRALGVWTEADHDA